MISPSKWTVRVGFTSEMFANRGTYGWCGSWAGDLYHALMYAQLQPDILFDQTIVAGGLEGYKVLVSGPEVWPPISRPIPTKGTTGAVQAAG